MHESASAAPATTWVVNVFVAATPISGPALQSRTASQRRASEECGRLVTAQVYVRRPPSSWITGSSLPPTAAYLISRASVGQPSPPPHAGTTDVDLVLDLQLLSTIEAYRRLEQNLKVLVERGPATPPEAAAALKAEVERRVRNALSVKADVRIVSPDTFEKPGAKKVTLVLRAMPDLAPDALELTWRSLGEIANLSSASVLHILRDTIAKPPPSGSPGLMLAMGPGFCSELVLLSW